MRIQPWNCLKCNDFKAQMKPINIQKWGLALQNSPDLTNMYQPFHVRSCFNVTGNCQWIRKRVVLYNQITQVVFNPFWSMFLMVFAVLGVPMSWSSLGQEILTTLYLRWVRLAIFAKYNILYIYIYIIYYIYIKIHTYIYILIYWYIVSICISGFFRSGLRATGFSHHVLHRLTLVLPYLGVNQAALRMRPRDSFLVV